MEKTRKIKKKLTEMFMQMFSMAVVCLLIILLLGLFIRSFSFLKTHSLPELLFSVSWHPLKGEFGFFTFIVATIYITIIALILAVPISILSALYISEYASCRLFYLIKSLLDILAGIPSVVFGLWGVIIVVPFVKNTLAPLFGIYSSGYCVLSAGIVLAIMIVPVIMHVAIEVLKSIPVDLREAALSLGTTKWEMVTRVIFRKALSGIFAAGVLGLCRAFGETMAVMMVAGNVAAIPGSPFEPGYTLSSLIANNFGEMLSIPLYDSALMFASLLLFLIVIIFNVISHLILKKIKRNNI